jgi:MFS family permease
VVPRLLVEAGLPLPAHWQLYLPVVLVSFAIMAPPILYADRRNRPKPVLLGAIALLAAVEVCLVFTGSVLAYGAALLAFFVAFNVLEAMLPSLVTRVAPAHARGTAIGVYNTTQTLGLFLAGCSAGGSPSTTARRRCSPVAPRCRRCGSPSPARCDRRRRRSTGFRVLRCEYHYGGGVIWHR